MINSVFDSKESAERTKHTIVMRVWCLTYDMDVLYLPADVAAGLVIYRTMVSILAQSRQKSKPDLFTPAIYYVTELSQSVPINPDGGS